MAPSSRAVAGEASEMPLDDGLEVVDDLHGMQEGGDSADDGDDHLDEGDDVGEDEDGEEGGPVEVEDDSIHSFEGHGDAVLAVAWSPVHPDVVATGGQDDKAYLWRVGQDALESTAGSLNTFELEGHTDTVASLAFSCQGTYLATGGMDGLVKVWEVSNGQLVQTLEGPGDAIEWVRWHPKGNVVLAGSDDMTMWMWLAKTGACMQVFSGHSGPVRDGTFTPDGQLVVSVGSEEDCSLRVWSPKTGECLVSVSGHLFHEAGINCLAVHDQDNAVLTLTGDEEGSVRICNVTAAQQGTSARVVGRIDWHEGSVECVGWCKHAPLAASAGVDGFVRIWDINNPAIERSKCEHPTVVTRLGWHPTQPLVFSGCGDGVVRCWDLRTGALVRQWGGHTDAVQDIALSPDGSMLLTGSDDCTAKVFQMQP